MTAKIKAGEAFVIIGTVDKTAKDLRAIEQRFQQAGQTLTRMGMRIAMVGAGMTASLIKPLMDASAFQEDLNIFQVAFGDQADEVRKRIDAIGDATNRSSNRMLRHTGVYKQLFAGYGVGSRAANELAVAMTQAATDMSSFFNIASEGREGSLNRLRSALSGSSEVLDQFGINVKQMAVDQELKRLWDVGITGANEAQKAFARANIIIRTLGEQGVLGDANRTAMKFANAWRGFKDDLYDTSILIGNQLLPYMETFLARVNVLVPRLVQWVQANRNLVITYAKIAIGVTAVGVAMIALGAAIRTVGFALTGVNVLLAITKGILLSVVTTAGLLSGSLWVAFAAMAAFGAAIYAGTKNTQIFVTMWQHAYKWIADVVTLLGEGLMKGRMDLVIKYLAAQMEYTATTLKAAWQNLVSAMAERVQYIAHFWEEQFALASTAVKQYFLSALDAVRMAYYGWLAMAYEETARLFRRIPGLSGAAAGFEESAAEMRAKQFAGPEQRADDHRQKMLELYTRQMREQRALKEDLLRKENKHAELLAEQELKLRGIREEMEAAGYPDAALPPMPEMPDLESLIDDITDGAAATPDAGLSTLMPAALTRGSVAAAKAAIQNQRTNALLSSIADSSEGTEETLTSMYEEFRGLVAAGIGGV